jgi:hypothetical protein
LAQEIREKEVSCWVTLGNTLHPKQSHLSLEQGHTLLMTIQKWNGNAATEYVFFLK